MCVTQKRFFLDSLIVDQYCPMKESPDSGIGKFLASGNLKSRISGSNWISISVACESIQFSRLHPRRKTVCENEPRKNRLAFANGFSRRVKLETWDEKNGCSRKLSAVSLKIGIRGVESRIQNCLGFPPYMGRNDKSIFATEEMNFQCSDSFKITWKMISTKIDALSCLDFLAVHVCVIMWYCVSVNRARSKQPFCLSFLLIVFLSYPTGRLAYGKIEKKKRELLLDSRCTFLYIVCMGERSKFYKASENKSWFLWIHTQWIL